MNHQITHRDVFVRSGVTDENLFLQKCRCGLGMLSVALTVRFY